MIEVLGLKRARGTAGPLTVRIGDRTCLMEYSISPAGSDAVIGHIVLTLLDLVAAAGRLAPRHPDGPVWALRDHRRDDTRAEEAGAGEGTKYRPQQPTAA